MKGGVLTKRNIIKIDEEKCNGCGLCVSACAEGALQIVDGKARPVSESYCDGLGACRNTLPGAINIEEREAAPCDEAAVQKAPGEQEAGGRAYRKWCSLPGIEPWTAAAGAKGAVRSSRRCL